MSMCPPSIQTYAKIRMFTIFYVPDTHVYVPDTYLHTRIPKFYVPDSHFYVPDSYSYAIILY